MSTRLNYRSWGGGVALRVEGRGWSGRPISFWGRAAALLEDDSRATLRSPSTTGLYCHLDRLGHSCKAQYGDGRP